MRLPPALALPITFPFSYPGFRFCLNDGEVAVSNAGRFVGCRELDPVTNGKLALILSVDADAGETAGIVGCEFLVCFLDREPVC